MKKILNPVWIGLSALTLFTGCADLQSAKTNASAIQSVFAQLPAIKAKQLKNGPLNSQAMTELMAIDVQYCPPKFRSAWYDYLVAIQNMHRRVQRVAMIASAVGKPVTNLATLIRFTASDPTLGKYLLDALNQEDEALEKVERVAMGFGVMPKSGS